MTDDDRIFCWRTHQDVPGYVYLGDTRNGFGMFMDTGRYADGAVRMPRKQEGSGQSPAGVNNSNGVKGNGVHDTNKKKPKSVPTLNWTAYLNENPANAREVNLLAAMLGVNSDTLRRLQLGYVPETEDEAEHWLFPEKDAGDKVIGLLRRYANGKKRRMAGGRCGLIFDLPEVVTESVATELLVVEGPSDVAAALTMNLLAVGRRNNMGGTELLAPLIRQKVTEGVVVVILGENDRKAKGMWPGRDGAVHVATLLAKLTGRRIAWCMPPEGIKDLREWLWQSKDVDVRDKARCQQMGRDVLIWVRGNLQWIDPPENRGMCRNEEFVPDSLSINTRNSSNSAVGSTTENLGHFPESPTATSAASSSAVFPEWEALFPSTQEVIARGQTSCPCPKHYVPLLQGRSNPRIGLALRVDCRVYGCPVCGLRRRCRWLFHLMNIFDLQAALCVAVVGVDQLAVLRKYVHRQEGDYVAIAMTDGRLTFIASCNFPGAELTTKADAAEFAAVALQSLDTGKRKPISTSRAWALQEIRNEADYIRRGAAPIGRFGLVVYRLRRAQLDPFVQPDDRGARADWLFPGAWHEAQIEWFYEGLALPPGAGEATGENTSEEN
jgi:hypothetical protein